MGHHVDHQIARNWGLTQVRDIPDRSALRFYAEFPYLNADQATEAALREFGLPLEPADVLLSETDIRAKIKAIACYESQISTFWTSLESMEDDVRRAFTDPQTGEYVERYWKVAR